MPAAFEKCIRDGGRVRTKTLSGGRYMHVCFINGKSYAGEVKTKKTMAGTSKVAAKAMARAAFKKK